MNTNSQDKAVVRTVSTRQQLIETAVRVFSSNGFHRTSLDLIALEAGVSKMTIFYHFKNKEELVIAALDDTHQKCMASIREYAVERSSDAKSYISSVFGAVELLSGSGQLPNLYMRASAEFTEDDSPIRQVIATQVRSVEMRFSSLAIEAGFQDPHDVVRQLMAILRAVYATQLCPAGGVYSINAKKMADCVIRVSPAFAA
ncbi:MAG: TetR/AcrR family transcriptional regulator [Armatimonadota bacterium]